MLKCTECNNRKEFVTADFFICKIAHASSFNRTLPQTVQPISCAICGLVLNDRDFEKPKNSGVSATSIIKLSLDLFVPKEKIIKIRLWISKNYKVFKELNAVHNEKTLLAFILNRIEEEKA